MADNALPQKDNGVPDSTASLFSDQQLAEPRAGIDFAYTKAPGVVRWLTGSERGKYFRIQGGVRQPMRGCVKAAATAVDHETPAPYEALERRLSYAWKKARDRSYERKQPFNLSREQLRQMYDEQGGRCALTGVAFRDEEAIASRPANTPSLERINPDRGYEVGNCRLVTTIANSARNDFGDAAFYAMCKAASAYRAALAPEARHE